MARRSEGMDQIQRESRKANISTVRLCSRPRSIKATANCGVHMAPIPVVIAGYWAYTYIQALLITQYDSCSTVAPIALRRCLLGKAPVHLSNCCIPVAQVATRRHLYAPLHVISWPYLDIVSARSGGGHLLSLVRRCSTLCQMIYEIPQSA